MGVHGLWRLIDSAGKPVPLETLENKVLAVDISIWLHQAVKGFQDSKGASVPNAHLLGIYHRVCKLLYFKIKPVFVFDGGVPALKKRTIAKRTQSKLRNVSEADQIQKQLLSTLLKHTAVSKVLTEKIEASIATIPKALKPKKEDDMYILPANNELDVTFSSSDEESFSTETDSSPTKNWNLHTIDPNSTHFKSLPADVRHEILTDLKETRKQSSWGKLHELPKVSDDFSVYQMRRLLKRQAVQTALEEVEKEMGGKSLSLAELESILKDQGVIKNQDIGNRIASDENTKYLLVKDLKKAIEEAKEKEIVIPEEIQEDVKEKPPETSMKTVADQEYEDDLKRAIALSLECEPSTSNTRTPEIFKKKKNPAEFSFLDNLYNADFASSSSEDEETMAETFKTTKMSSAQSYMLEYSGLTPNEIAKIINGNTEKNDQLKKTKFVPIINEDEEIKNSVKENEFVKDSVVEYAERIEDSVEETTKSVEKVKESFEIVDKSVEIMSNSDSSDDDESEKKPLNIIIDPNCQIGEEDDLFADVFGSKQKTETKLVSKLEKNTLNIVIDPNDQIAKEDDSVADVFASKQEAEAKLEENITQLKIKDKTERNQNIQKTTISEQQLKDLKDQLQKDKVDLINAKSTKERQASNITDQMYQEAQELLELFGIPYIIAPMEAEAQCAFLDAVELTEGTITDDSDIWLFGGKTVYKNFFNQTKYVMEFRAENIQHHFKLTREQMILLALLVGSDYTVGLQGVGPVTAMEILAAFPCGVKEFSLRHADLLSGLKEFRSWFTKGKSPGPGRTSLKSKLKNLIFTENFPSVQVVQAYLDPTVETSKEAFSWGKPNAGALLEYAREKFGWTKTKTENIINPVLKKLEESKHQKSIRDYFKAKFKVHSSETENKMSKRVKTAITNMGRDPSEILAEEIKGELKKPAKTQRKKKNSQAPEFCQNTDKIVETDENEKQIVPTSKVNLEKLKTSSNKLKKLENSEEKIHKIRRRRKTNEEANEVEIKKPKLAKNKELNEENPVDVVSEKIDQIRRRRKMNEAKAAIIEIKKPKLAKEKKLSIPKELGGDEEVNFLSEIVAQSSQKVEEINKNMMEKLRAVQTGKLTSDLTQPQPSTSKQLVRVPKKETIPQKEKDKTILLRNKLKAIEVYRKGKHGPGFVSKRTRNRKLPKEDAELSESSDNE